MAYTVVMTKKAVNQVSDVLYNITVNCKINDGETDVFDQDITHQHNTNAPDLDSLKSQILEDLQDEWDEYKAEKTMLDSVAMDTALSEMQATATTYVNS